MKYTTKENALKKATGMDKKGRADFRNEVDFWMDKRRNAKTKTAKKEAEKNINRLMHW